jgi:hypothetical protein
MANYLIIDNNKVINVIVADSKEIAEQVTGKEAIDASSLDVQIGWTRSGDTWAAPEGSTEDPA